MANVIGSSSIGGGGPGGRLRSNSAGQAVSSLSALGAAVVLGSLGGKVLSTHLAKVKERIATRNSFLAIPGTVKSMGPRGQVSLNNRFTVLLDGGETSFATISGIKQEVEAITYRTSENWGTEGNVTVPGHIAPAMVTFEKGVSQDHSLTSWFNEVRSFVETNEDPGEIGHPEGSYGTAWSLLKARNVDVKIFDRNGKLLRKVILNEAWPKSISYNNLNAMESQVLIESFTLVCRSLVIDDAVSGDSDNAGDDTGLRDSTGGIIKLFSEGNPGENAYRGFGQYGDYWGAGQISGGGAQPL